MAKQSTEKVYKPEGYTEDDQRSDTSFLVGVRYGWRKAMREAADLLDGHAEKCGDPADNGHIYADLLRAQSEVREVVTWPGQTGGEQ